MQDNFQKEFDYQVRQKAVALLEKREIDIQRKYRLQFQTQQARYEKELKDKFDREIREAKSSIQAELAEIQRLKSAELVRMKK